MLNRIHRQEKNVQSLRGDFFMFYLIIKRNARRQKTCTVPLVGKPDSRVQEENQGKYNCVFAQVTSHELLTKTSENFIRALTWKNAILFFEKSRTRDSQRTLTPLTRDARFVIDKFISFQQYLKYSPFCTEFYAQNCYFNTKLVSNRPEHGVCSIIILNFRVTATSFSTVE